MYVLTSITKKEENNFFSLSLSRVDYTYYTVFVQIFFTKYNLKYAKVLLQQHKSAAQTWCKLSSESFLVFNSTLPKKDQVTLAGSK
jgi:hypothetical protein